MATHGVHHRLVTTVLADDRLSTSVDLDFHKVLDADTTWNFKGQKRQESNESTRMKGERHHDVQRVQWANDALESLLHDHNEET